MEHTGVEQTSLGQTSLAQMHTLLLEVKDILLQKKKKPTLRSAELNELFAALAEAQGRFPSIVPNRENSYYKRLYTDWDAVLRSIRPILSEQGLSLIQDLRIEDDGSTSLYTILGHKSGQYMQSKVRVESPKNDLQVFGSSLLTMKRYAGMSLLGLTVGNDPDDDDSEVAMHEIRGEMKKGTKPTASYDPKKRSYQKISTDQLDELHYVCGDYPDIVRQVLDDYRISSLSDMSKEDYMPTIERVREIIAIRKGLKKK